MIGYDKIPENEDILLDLPFREGTGTVTMDVAKPHHPVTLNDPGGGSFVWTSLPSGLMALEFITTGGGAAQGVYLECDSTETADLDFIAGDYSLGCWINWTAVSSSIIMGRYQLNVSGWELYLYNAAPIYYLTQRHHHASTIVGGNPRSGCYSVGWTPGEWCFMGSSRTGGGEAYHYRNGVELTMSTGGLVDPETDSSDLVTGCRFTKDSDWYKGLMWRPRIWDRILSASEWMNIFKSERDWFGI